MASHVSIGSASKSKSRGRANSAQSQLGQVYCYHDEVAPLRAVRHDGPTKGKRFYGCSYWPEQRTCGYFKWHDEVDDVRVVQQAIADKGSTIMELKDENMCLRDRVKKLKSKKEVLEDEVAEMGIATTKTMYELKEHNTDRKLMLTLVFSWCFFTLVLLFK
uniref:GRF-type domain-containing protein n=1 Tax=Chenopodium quinoa TaxID=63459 RepID=A0A803N1D8_CHEQI